MCHGRGPALPHERIVTSSTPFNRTAPHTPRWALDVGTDTEPNAEQQRGLCLCHSILYSDIFLDFGSCSCLEEARVLFSFCCFVFHLGSLPAAEHAAPPRR